MVDADRPLLRVLVVDDDPDDWVLARDMLAEAEGARYEVAWARSYAEAIGALERGGLDAVLLDYRLGEKNGLELLNHPTGAAVRAPIILLTGQGDLGVDRAAMQAGAADYLNKAHLVPAFLDQAVRHAVERARTLEALRVALAQLEEANQRIVDEHARLVRAERLATLGTLAAGVAHEINNPLTGVLGCVRSLRKDGVDAGRREEYLETMQEGLDRIRHTVRALLDLSRQRAPTFADVAVADVVGACARLASPVARGRGVVLDARPVSPELRVHGDRAQLMHALLNVVLNAVHASPPEAVVEVRAAREADVVEIGVADRGPGIPPDVLRRVGEPFFTTKPEGEGTGLGLSITRGILEAHGGRLRIASSPGAGTTVTLRVPAARLAAQS